MGMQQPKLLVVDDQSSIRFGISKFFSRHGFEVLEAATCAAALELFASVQPEAAIIDCFLPDGQGLSWF